MPPRRSRTAPRIVIVGSVNMDLVARVPRLPRPGETLAGSSFATFPGGKGANQAVAVARLGGRSVFVGRVGNDPFGKELLRSLRNEGVDVRHVRTLPDTSSGVAVIAVEDSGQNAITVIPGANALLRPDDVRAVESVIASADALLVQLEIPLDTVHEAIRLAQKHRVLTVLDPAPVPPNGLPARWKNLSIDIISPNETEAAQLGGRPCSNDKEAIACVESMLMDSKAVLAVLKRGSRGALLHAFAKPCFFPAFPVKVVDTTAAGDAFSAALTLRFSETGATLGEAIHFANAAGALATTRLGAQASMPTRKEVDAFLRDHPYGG
ncbi:MAG: ribokinase [Verrucomicrobiales bacterium]|nr:ribokinase [Verrucomicrobiales bacterium]